MRQSIFEQSEIFRYAFLFGLIIGAFYDVFRFLRKSGLNSQTALFFEDVIFMAVSGVLCFMFSQTTCHGHFRFFVMLGHILGFASYRLSIGFVTGFLFDLISKVIRAVFGTFNSVIIQFARLIQKMWANLSTAFDKIHKSQPHIYEK